MALKLRLDTQAGSDLAEIRSYLTANTSPAIAERVRKHIRVRINRLTRNPHLGVITTVPEIRILPPTRYPYRIYYTVTTDAVVILHIRHTSRRKPDLTDFEV